MIDVIIASYNEPKATLKAVNVFLKQKTKQKIRVTVVDPFPEVEKFLKENIKDKRFNFFLDPGEGKSYALNILFQEYASDNKDDIFILTDGDVYVSENVLDEIIQIFKDKEIGCATGKPVSIDSRKTKYGYWSHFLFKGIHKARKKLSNNKKYFECSGYLFAIRKNVIIDFPMEVSEDCIIPYLFWRKKYRIVYAPNIKVYVKNPNNWKDWLNQKVRNVKGHENLHKFFSHIPRTKSFFNEIKHGIFFIVTYPKNPREFCWTIQIYFARLYLYFKAFRELKINKEYSDGWRETEIKSTKPLD